MRHNEFEFQIRQLTEAMKTLKDRFDEGRRPNESYRVLFVTKNPFFGMLTYQGRTFTERFADELTALANCLERYNKTAILTNGAAIDNGSRRSGFDFRVICADTGLLNKFHLEVIKEISDEASAKSLAPKMTQEVDEKLRRIDHLAGYLSPTSVFKRVDDIPPTQFMIIGDTLYEFTLESTRSGSDVRYADIKEDKRACDRYQETFEVYYRRL